MHKLPHIQVWEDYPTRPPIGDKENNVSEHLIHQKGKQLVDERNITCMV